jgi:hypothetical protein
MAIAVVNGTPVPATGSVNQTTINVAAPALLATDVHVIVATVNATGATISTPSGYTLLQSRLLTTSAPADSSTSAVFVFYRKGTASANGAVAVTSTAAGRLAAVPFTLTGCHATTPIESSAVGTYLTAPARTSTAATLYVAAFGVREGTAAAVSPPNSFGVAVGPAGLTEIDDICSVVDNGATQVAAEASYVTVAPGGTVTSKTVTTDADTGFVAAAVSFLVVPTAVAAPDAPVITVTSGNTQDTVNWTAPNNNGASITGYTLQRQDYQADGTTIVTAWSTLTTPSAAATSFIDTGLTNGLVYGYRLSATNSSGTSSYSTEVKGSPDSASLPAPGTPSITCTAGPNVNKITWSTPALNGYPILTYTLQRRTYSAANVAGAYQTIVSPIATAVAYSDSNVVAGTKYGYHLLATNTNGDSAYSTEATGTPTTPSVGGGYGAVVQATTPDHYYPLNGANAGADLGNAATKANFVTDTAISGGTAITGPPTYGSVTLNGSTIDGARFVVGQSLKLANLTDFSVTKTGALTIMFHFTVDSYNTGVDAGDNLKHIFHKSESPGGTKEHEWAFRNYADENRTDNGGRPRRHSIYHYNRDLTSSQGAGQGAGSYFQPGVGGVTPLTGGVGSTNGVAETAIGTEHVMLLVLYTNGGGLNTRGTKIYVNGVKSDEDNMADYAVVPSFSQQWVRLGRSDYHNSWFVGRVRRVAFWNRILTASEISSLNNATNRALSEGSGDNSAILSVPSQPLNATGPRSSVDPAAATVTWTAPSNNGGSAITGYTVVHNNGGVGDIVTSSLLSAATLSYSLSGLPSGAVTVRVYARNAQGDSIPALVTVPAATPQALTPIGTLSDNFNAGVDPNRVFYPSSSNVSQVNGEIEWGTVDATKRGTYVIGSMVGQSAFHRVSPDLTPNVVTCMFVRSDIDPTKQVRIAYLGTSIVCRVDDGTPDASPTSTPYVAANMRYWRVLDNGTTVSLQYSADGSTWSNFPRSGFATPTWFNDVRVGVEAYTGTSV